MEDTTSNEQLLQAIQTEEGLQDYYQRQEFIRQTAQQIQKDFAEFGIEISFSGNPDTAYDELFRQMNGHLQYILDTQHSVLFNLLYRIDLSIAAIEKGILLHPEANTSELLSDLIIKRELKKVLLRHYFKKQAEGNPTNSDSF